MKTQFNTLQEAIEVQTANAHPYNYAETREVNPSTGVDVLDLVQFYSPGIAWLIIAENFYLGDWEEGVTQYGLNTAGNWVAISDSHCSCFGWQAGAETPEEYPSLDILLAADAGAGVILKHWETLLQVYPFVAQHR